MQDLACFAIILLRLAISVHADSEGCTTTFERLADVTLPDQLLEESEVYERLTASECYDLCAKNVQCGGYLLHHVIDRCIIVRVMPDDLQPHLIQDGLWNYHRKICLSGKLCKRQWSFDRVMGVQLYGYDDRIIRDVETEDRCLQHCISEDSFVCRSARHDRSNKTCILSRHDRRTAPEAFRRSFNKVDYLENQCVSDPSKCSFLPRKNRVLIHRHVHIKTGVVTKDECEALCLNHTDFICRSYSYDKTKSMCLMTPEDSYSSEDGALGTYSEGHLLYERGSCIEVEMNCEATTMTAIIKVVSPFRGRVYALGRPYECYVVSVGSNGEVALSMPLRGRKCGTKNLGNGTFSNSVVVQHHPYVLRTTDRRIDIACDYEEVQRKLRGGKQVLEGDLQSLTQVITGLAQTPPIKLRVVNSSGDEVKGVRLGESLQLKVEMTDESVFGIFGSGLVARSGQGTETVLLIDDRGCPVEPTVFPALLREDGTKSLMGKFQAFKFASDPTVKFQLTVSFCLDVCTPADCNEVVSEAAAEFRKSHGKRKRRSADYAAFELQTGDVVTDVTMESDLFVVNTMKANQPAYDSSRRTHFAENESSRIRLGADRGLCFTRPVFYVGATIAATLQLILMASCTALLITRRRFFRGCGTESGLGSSRESVSSRTGLYSSKS